MEIEFHEEIIALIIVDSDRLGRRWACRSANLRYQNSQRVLGTMNTTRGSNERLSSERGVHESERTRRYYPEDVDDFYRGIPVLTGPGKADRRSLIIVVSIRFAGFHLFRPKSNAPLP